MATNVKNGLDSKQVCDIIESCAKSRVVKLKFGDLEIEFAQCGSNQPSILEGMTNPQETAPTNSKTPEAAISDQQHEDRNKEALESDELNLRDDQMAELLLVNPVAHEEMVASGDLEDADSEFNDGSSDERPSEHDVLDSR